MRELDRRVARPPALGQAVREAHAERLLARDAASGEDHVHRLAVADEPWQAHRAEVDQRHAPAPAEDAEDGVRGGDAEVAPQRQLESARDRVPLDRGDDRLSEQHARRPHGPVPVLAENVLPERVDQGAAPELAGGDRLQIGAGAERAARAGQDRDRERLVRVEAAKRPHQRRRGRVVDRVAHLGPVDGDDGDFAVRLE